MTTEERWRRLERILDELLDLPPEERGARLDVLSAGDATMRDEVLALLREGAKPGGVLDGSVESLIAGVFQADPVPAQALRAAPRNIGPYRVLEELGRGGMGEVLLAERADGQFEHRVALKIVRTGPDRGEIIERFRHERQILARLRHPNIASLYDGGTDEDGAPYFAMEYVEGRRITEYADEKRLDLDSRLELFESVCAAVSEAHRNLVIHRDLKPSNVLVTADGTVKLLDFGIAKVVDPESGDATQTTRGFLTPAYASPEHLRGAPTTTATDVYSLGVLLYELLTGRHPHGDTSSSAEVIRAVLQDEPREASAVVTREARGVAAAAIADQRSSVPAELRRKLRGDLDNVLAKALRRNPEDRYRSVEELRADLERYRRSLPVSALPATASYRLRKFVRRNRVSVSVAFTLVSALIVFAVSMSILYSRSEANLARALEAEAAAGREAETAKQVSDFMTGLFRVSNPYDGAWEELTARQIMDRAVERIRKELDDQPLVRARLLGTLAIACTGLGRVVEARQLHEEELAIKRETLGENDLGYAESLNNYALLLDDAADYAGALRAHRQALSIREASLGPEHLLVAQSLGNLGGVYRGLGDLDSSRIFQERALAIRKKLLGPDDDAVATSTFNLGVVHLHRRDPAAARPLFEEAYRIHKARLGENHTRTLKALSAVAAAMQMGGAADSARPILRRVIELQEGVLGPSHPEIGVALLTLAVLERESGESAQATALVERTLRIWEATYGPEHPRVGDALGELAELQADAGKIGAARDLALKALAIVEKVEANSPRTAEHLERVGDLEKQLGDEAAAMARYERAESIAVETLGANHDAVASIREKIAGLTPARAAR